MTYRSGSVESAAVVPPQAAVAIAPEHVIRADCRKRRITMRLRLGGRGTGRKGVPLARTSQFAMCVEVSPFG